MSEAVQVTGHVILLPFIVREGLRVDKQMFRPAPWSPPPFQGLQAMRLATGEAVLMVVAEMPLHIYPWEDAISQHQLEDLHFQKFTTDYRLALGEAPYRNIRRGADPPDFVALASETDRQIDCTQFTLEARRTIQGLFRGVRHAISAASRDRFSHLQGLLLYVWADTARQPLDLPLRRAAQQELVDVLAGFRFRPETGVVIGGGLSPQAPDMGVATSAAGWRVYATPLSVAAPASPFFIRMGFELAFHCPTEHTAADVWAEFERLVVQHDQSTVEDLIITVGGPDRAGYIYPGEEAVFDFMLAGLRISELPTKHLRRVLVHCWESGRIVQINPELRILSAGLFMATIPAHQPLVAR